MMESVLETERLALRHLREDDAPFILELVNDPSWLEYIGNKNIKTLEQAEAYIRKGPVASYAKNGFGLYLVVLKVATVPLGICGLVKRDSLKDIDLGFALRPQYWSNGYAREAAEATMGEAKALKLKRVVAITSPGNHASIRLLEKLGFKFEEQLKLPGDDKDVKLFGAAI